MFYNSYEFLFLFLPVVLFLFYLVQKTRYVPACLVILILSSLFFHTYYKASYTQILLLSIGANFYISKILRTVPQHVKKLFLIFGIVFNLSLLSFFKYYNFFIDIVNLFYYISPHKDIILPLAISFYTFQQIAFLVDSYRGEARNNTFIESLSYISFFPDVIAV